ncbi:MAG: fructose-bisphosphate aldolase [Candidatus Pacearchaeota archaeon]
MVSLSKITYRGRALYLAYDQGLEHGPESDFNDKNVDPLYILDIAKKAKFNGVVFHLGIAEKYNKEIRKLRVPLILKLNGKTKLVKGEPKSAMIASVEDAIRLKASAVGFTIYIGSKFEEEIIEDFVQVRRMAHARGLPVIAWVYPRGGKVRNDVSRENMVYAARTGLEVGADIVKIKYGGVPEDLNWAVKAAGRCKVVIAGGVKKLERDFLKNTRDIIKSGAIGLAVGRNVWQSKNPIGLSKKLHKIIFD